MIDTFELSQVYMQYLSPKNRLIVYKTKAKERFTYLQDQTDGCMCTFDSPVGYSHKIPINSSVIGSSLKLVSGRFTSVSMSTVLSVSARSA